MSSRRNVSRWVLPMHGCGLAPPKRLTARGVELRCDARAKALMPGSIDATKEDWSTEYNDLILSVKVVDSLEEAIAHIETYGTHHSDAIVTECYQTAERFLNEVNSAAVYVNASTRFTDGEEFGFGAEIGAHHFAGVCGLEVEAYRADHVGEIVGLYTITRFKGEGVGGRLIARALDALEAGRH